MLKTLAVAALLSMQAPVYAAPEYEGRWVTHCLNGLATCILDVEKKGKGYEVGWVAMDRAGTKTLCEFSARMRIGTWDKNERYFENVLTGTLKGTKMKAMVSVGDTGDEAMVLTEGAGCSVPGDYVTMFGFYAREYVDY